MESIHLEDLTGSILMRVIASTELQINIKGISLGEVENTKLEE